MICSATSTTRAAKKRAVPSRYPQFSVMVMVSPAVSPNVVAAILMTQKESVTSGTFLNALGMTFVFQLDKPLVQLFANPLASGPRGESLTATDAGFVSSLHKK